MQEKENLKETVQEIKAKYTLKDSVFSDLFQNKKYLIQLYQTLHPEDKEVTEQSLTNITIENIPVIEDENTISVYYVIKNVTSNVEMQYLDFYLQHASSFVEVGDGVRKWQLEKYSKEWVYFNVESGDGKYNEYLSRWVFEQFDLGPQETKIFKITFELKKATGNFEATIY